MKPTADDVLKHYVSCWVNRPVVRRWEKGPFRQLPSTFRVLEFSPTEARRMWTYATCGMSLVPGIEPLELHLFSPTQYDAHIELLTTIAHFHCTDQPLSLGHTVCFGRPWMNESISEYGLISLPYLDGPSLETLVSDDGSVVSCLWLIPITKAERDFKAAVGLEALERKLEEIGFDYSDPLRPSAV